MSITRMKTSFQMLFLSIAVLSGVAGSARAEAPILEFAGYINGVMNIWATNAVPPTARVVQMKPTGADDSAYVDVSFVSTAYSESGITFDCYYLATNWPGSACFRIGNIYGEQREFTDIGSFETVLGVAPISVKGYTNWGGAPANAFDGLINTSYDTGDEPNLGILTIDLGRPCSIRGVRYALARFSLWKLDRVANAVIECSDTGDFAGEQTQIAVLPATSDPIYTEVKSLVFDSTVTARYFRYKAADNTWGSIAELELVAGDLSACQVAPEVSYSDLTNLYPVIVGTPSAFVRAVRSVIQRADAAEGPFVDVGEWVEGSGPVTYINTEDRVGRIRYYRLRSVCGRPGYENTVADGPAVCAVRCRRLDRDWGDETKLRSGLSLIDPGVYMEPEYVVGKAFDGNPNTFADAYDPNPNIGLDFGEAGVHIVGIRVLPRPDSYPGVNLQGRLNFASLLVGQTTSRTDATCVTTGHTSYDFDVYWTYLPTVPTAQGMRYVWLCAIPDGYWYGNVAEFQLFGWTDKDTEKSIPKGLCIILK